MTFLIFIIIISAIFVCFMVYWEIRGRQLEAQRISQRNADLIRAMKKFAFGSILFRESTECVICLSAFNQNDEIIQLKCSKYHIFHYECFKRHLTSQLESNQLCPLCRERIQIQDPPILK